jgi:glycosyltransferase involved in cell wall biosynthesis
MPSYNHEEFIREAIQSVLNQTYQDYELIITDDGSTDGTVSEINKFSDARMKLYRHVINQGAAVALENCIAHSSGELIAVLNSDDAYYPLKLEKQIEFIDKHQNIGAVFSFAEIINEAGEAFNNKEHFYYNIFKQPNRTRFQWLNYFFHHGNCLCHPSVLARRECYTSLAPQNLRLARLGDFNRWVQICMKYEIHIIPEYLVKFRVLTGERNVSSYTPENKIQGGWELSQILKHYLKIGNITELTQVFPEIENDYKVLDNELIPFYLANLALKSSHRIYQFFGVDTLYNLLGNKKIVIKLKEKHDFSYIDLFNRNIKIN